MRVLHVHSGNLYGGVETFLRTLVRSRRLSPSMEPEFALCFDDRIAGELRDEGARVVILGGVRLRRPDTVWRARQALGRLLRERTYDVVVCHQAWPLAIFGTVAKAAGIPLAAWVHMAQSGRHWLERLAGQVEPDCYVCNSKYTASALPRTNARVEVVYYPVVVREIASPRRPTPAVDSATCAVIQVSRMEAWKGHTVLIDALAQLRDERGWTCELVGGAQRPAERRYLESLRTRVARAGIDDRVSFPGQRWDVAERLDAADVFCQPNLEPEPFGISLVEALGAGLPVVTSAIGGALEIVTPSCGVLVEPGNARALAAELSHLVRDPARRNALGRRGPDRARELCDPSMQINRIAAILDSVASRRAVVH
jgi:glycosyltransferase involved in cell wall biosynthesis